MRTLSLEPADRLLRCTDGLTKHLTDEAIGVELGAAEELSSAAVAQRLVDLAKRGGREDNVTAVVTRFVTVAPGARSRPADAR